MPLDHTSKLILTSAVGAGLASSAAIALKSSRRAEPESRKILLSPRTTLLPKLTPAQARCLGYPPDALPGSRDVSTPYGSMRVYEWGPIEGRKVIMIHGDATPSPVFGPMANELVGKGCRILAFDLWGRGYTDTPTNIQHHSRLYMQQIHFAISSSPIQWTGPTRFSIVGFSMGGSIALNFFAHQPSLVESLVLLGPGGLICKLPSEYESFYFKYPGLASKAKMRSLIGTVLGMDLSGATHPETLPVYEKAEGFTPARALQFQFDYHPGHIESFLSTIQYGPLQHQEEVWNRALDVVAGKSETANTPLFGGKMLVICGKEDTVVPAEDVKPDLIQYLGHEGEHWTFKIVPGGHGFPWPEGNNIGSIIADFWNMKNLKASF